MMQEPKLTFQAFRQWWLRMPLSEETSEQARLCLRHIKCLELNMPYPGRSLIAGAVTELHKLEAMLAFPTI